MVREDKQAIIANRLSEWWICYNCWVAYHVPTTRLYGDCVQCHWPTVPSGVSPDRLNMLEMNLTPKKNEVVMTRQTKLRLGEVGYFVKVPDELIEILKWTYHDPLVLMVGTGGCLVVEKEVEAKNEK